MFFCADVQFLEFDGLPRGPDMAPETARKMGKVEALGANYFYFDVY